jgi:hypothetical protein
MIGTVPSRNAIARLIHELRSYFRDLDQSREELVDGISSEDVLPPIAPSDGKRLNSAVSGDPGVDFSQCRVSPARPLEPGRGAL